MRKLALITVVLLVFIGCNSSKKQHHKPNDKPVARVFDKYLFRSEVQNVIPKGVSPDDSALYAEQYINSWVEQQLMATLAEKYIDKQQLDQINKRVQQYKNSLLITAFRNKLIEEKLDTNVSLDLINEYYERHKKDFILQQPVIRGFWFKVPLESENLGEIRNLAFTQDIEDINNLRNLVINSRGTFDDFRTQWRYFNEVMSNIPYVVTDPNYFLKYQSYLQTQDDNYYYFLKISDYKLKGDYMPLTLCQDDIKRIILNHRIKLLINSIEKKLYDEAVSKGNVKIFD